MKVEYDKRRDVVYFSFSSGARLGRSDSTPARIIDYGADGAVVGVEFLSPSRGIELPGLPRAVEIEHEARRLGLTILVPASAA